MLNGYTLLNVFLLKIYCFYYNPVFMGPPGFLKANHICIFFI